MAAHRLGEMEDVPRFSVVAQFVEGQIFCAVSHVGILANSSTLKYGSPAEVYDMAPPLRLGSVGHSGIRSPSGGMTAHVVGWLEMNQDQKDGIIHWLSSLKGRFAARMPDRIRTPESITTAGYIVYPAMRMEKRDRVTGIVIHEGYSCVGFVLSCYQYGAGVRLLVDQDSGHIPLAGMSTISRTYPARMVRIVQNDPELIGLKGGGPWPILFGGYVMHSLKNDIARSNGVLHAPHLSELKF